MSNAANKVVLLVDRSSLMPFAEAQPALAAFLNLLQPGNEFAVLGYRVRTTPIYPQQGLACYDDRQVIDEATHALIATTVGGDRSNLTAVLRAGANRLAESTPPKSLVLVASSDWNAGRDPLENLPDVPVQTIALGDHGQQDTLRAIAQGTGGKYNFVADASGLISVLIELVEQLGIAQILTTGSRKVSNQQPYSLVGRFAEGTEVGTFLVFWGDPSITYGTGSGPRWVTAELIDPNGNPFVASPVWAEDGFAVFSLPKPMAGSWSLKSTFVGQGTCTFTNAIFA